jgi:hypothetical protein
VSESEVGGIEVGGFEIDGFGFEIGSIKGGRPGDSGGEAYNIFFWIFSSMDGHVR